MTFYFAVFHVDAESYIGRSDFPIAIFSDNDKAIEYAKKQPGYGYNLDWFVKPIPLDPS